MPKVSVISTVYNEEDNIEKTAESILSQTYEDFEWVLVDDHSTDTTPEILADLEEKHSKVRVVRPKTRPGRATALNHAVEIAEGKYIAQQDIDDISYPERLAKQVSHLDENPNVGGLGCYYRRIDRIRGEEYIREYPTSHEKLKKSLGCHIPIVHTLAMFRKQAWRDAGGYPDSGVIEEYGLEDYGFWIRMVASGWELSTIPAVLGNHIVYEESSFHSKLSYASRQRRMANVQAKAIQDLDLPIWMYIYVIGRYIYPFVPKSVKKPIRQIMSDLKEKEIDEA